MFVALYTQKHHLEENLKMSGNIYEVERVLDVRSTKRGKRYLIQWKVFSKDTWEPEENLVDCKEAIDLFYAEKAKKDEIEKQSQFHTPTNPKSIKKVQQKRDVKEVSTKKVVVKKQETEIRPTPLTRRSVRLSQKSEEVKKTHTITQPKKPSPTIEPQKFKICAEKKKCPAKYYAYFLVCTLVFVIVFMSLPSRSD
ncbi:chromobox protein homolog 1-like [Anneissia japonica]|uniref:chromobox protein homolog 1-like n=1 Tax=Anneissia japonica TaxID=1529436 RepID=UPI001425AD1C|nr:chromobox protein homolog 1-like [Anneissia japonica]